MPKYKFLGKPSGARPTYFKACCIEAEKGGSYGYDHPGYHLFIHIQDLHFEGDIDDKGYEELNKLIEKGDDNEIIEWFKWYLPRCIALVPSRKYKSFLKGFWRGVEEDR